MLNSASVCLLIEPDSDTENFPSNSFVSTKPSALQQKKERHFRRSPPTKRSPDRLLLIFASKLIQEKIRKANKQTNNQQNLLATA
jgi:hypothetical protein